MKANNFLKSIKLTLAFCVVLGICYVLVLWLFAQLAAPGKNGDAELVTLDGKVVGAANVGQEFTKDIYFWGRPSAAGYNGGASAGSNKGPTNEEYLDTVEERIDSFLVHHPYLDRSEIPVEMVTASGSGLDPDITPECAYVQVRRVAEARGMSEDAVRKIVDENVQRPLLRVFGPDRINVLKLNVALDSIAKAE